MELELMPHQQQAVKELHNGAILTGGMGSGKTITALWYFWEEVCGGVAGQVGSPTKPKDLYVITTAKKRDSLDWETEASKVGIAMLKEHSPTGMTMTVDSWNNIGKYEGVTDAYFIFDEQRLVGSGAWSKSFIKIARSNDWIVLSATPGDTWLDYIPVFIANGFYRNRTEFKREHVVYNTYSKFPKVERYTGVGRLVRCRNAVLVKMPFQRHTTWNEQYIEVDYDHKLLERVTKDRWHVYENRPLRDVSELFAVMRKVVNSDTSRLEKIRNLAAKHPKLIVFYNFDYELEQLRQLATETPSESHSTCLESSQNTLGSSKKGRSASTMTETEDEWTLQTSAQMRMVPTEQSSQEPSSKVLSDTHSSTHSGTGLSTAAITHSTGSKTGTGESLTDLEVANLMAGLPLHTPAHVTPKESPATFASASDAPAIVVAELNGHKHDPVPTGERWIYLVQYVAGAEAWNCVETDAMVFYSQTYSYKIFHQAHGRIDRLNTPFSILHYYILKSEAWIDQQIAKSLRNKKNFNESEYRQMVHTG